MRKFLRTKGIETTVKRFYIPKKVELPNGEVVKFSELESRYEGDLDILSDFARIRSTGQEVKYLTYRPIGAPDVTTKIILNMLVHIVNEYNYIHLRDYQHGFRPQRGTASACMMLREKLLKRRKFDGYDKPLKLDAIVYEFDLKGFFNKVNPYFTCLKLAEGGLKATAN